MTAQPLWIIGASGFGREVEHLVRAINLESDTWHVAGFVDDGASEENRELVRRLGHEIIGGVDDLLQRPPQPYVIGIGSGPVRATIDQRLTAAGWEAATLIHPSASLGHDVLLGAGTVICAGVRMTTNISLGRHVHINLNSTVGHDSTLADYATVNPLVAISGGVTLGARSMVGTSAAVLQNLAVGPDAVVGAGAVVVRDVPANVTVKGLPAK